MIYYFTPYQTKNLGQAYNHYCDLVPNDDDWITFSDGDVMQLHLNWGEIWQSILERNNDAGIVTCLSNRAIKANIDQVVFEMYDKSDIIEHKKFALKLWNSNGYITKSMTQKIFSGFFFSFKKRTWKEVGGFMDGILHVDTDFFHKIIIKNKKCLVAQGFYVLHYYRLMEGCFYKKHLRIPSK
jgi:hypothetical protein